MTDEIKTLDLSELLGAKKALKVLRDGIEYELSHIDSMGAYKIMQFQSLRSKVIMLQLVEDVTEEQASEIEKLFDRMLHMLCEDLPLGRMTYVEKTTIIAFYFTETSPKKAKSPNRKALTGAISSQS